MTLSLVEEFKRSWLTSLIGLVALIAGFCTLSWNEGRAVHRSNSLDEAFDNVIELNVHEPVLPEYDGRLVHLTGRLLIEEPLTEPEYGVAIQCVQLKRRVQMFQWVEERTPRDYGDVTNEARNDYNDFYYVTEWRDKLVDSRSFYIRHGHQNPTSIPLENRIQISPTVKVGQHTLGIHLKRKFIDYVEVTSDDRPERRDIKLHLGIYYHSDDVWHPEVGDIRVQFYYAGANGEWVSIVGMQKNGIIVPFHTSKGHEFLLLRHGTLNVFQMFHAEHSDAKFETWKLRGIGIFMLYAATVCLSKLLRIFISRISGLRRILAGEMTSSRHFVIAASVGLFVIGISWFVHRPMLAMALLSAAVSPLFYCTLTLMR